MYLNSFDWCTWILKNKEMRCICSRYTCRGRFSKWWCLWGLIFEPLSCISANCYLDCKEGYKMNEEGVEICECANPHPVCPSMEDCKKQCTYGLKVSRNGCHKCSCIKCPTFSCSKKCVHGYSVNRQGCKLCKCKGMYCKLKWWREVECAVSYNVFEIV